MNNLQALEIEQVDTLLNTKNIFSNIEIGKIQDLISYMEATIHNLEEELKDIRDNYFEVTRNY